jgi:hypothetical protein
MFTTTSMLNATPVLFLGKGYYETTTQNPKRVERRV